MRLLPNDIAVLDFDDHISVWVEESGRLDIAKDALECVHQYIQPGTTVIDIGASIGDHTVTYADWVGPTGLVIAIEPQEESFACLRHNIRKLKNARCYQVILSDGAHPGLVMESMDNAGASYVKSTRDGRDGLDVMTLDSLMENVPIPEPLFIKIDAEGSELNILRGASETISQYRPVMLVELNQGALFRQHTSGAEVCRWLTMLGYQYKPTDPRLKLTDPQLDILCLPA